MATTSKGTPYVEAADLVSGYPTVSLNLAEHIDDNVAYNAATINAQTGTTYTFVLADATEGKLVTATNAASQTYTVPPESSVAWPAGSILRILNQGAGVVTVAAGSGVTINGTPLTLAQYNGAAIQKTGTDTWTFIPFSGGAGRAVISSPAATGSYSSGGTTYNYYTFTASGTVTVDTEGTADCLIIAGAGGGGGSNNSGSYGGGGGAGGYIYQGLFLSGSYTVTVGAGGAGVASNTASKGTNGNNSRLGSVVAVGGGGGAQYVLSTTNSGLLGGSGGGSTAGLTQNLAGASGTPGQGNDGGAGNNGVAGSGGGAGSAATGITPGSGIALNITGSSVTRAVGGNAGAGSTVSGAANSGTGGGGGYTSYASGNGGSGIVIIRVAV